MKLLFCPKCGDVKKLVSPNTYCECGESAVFLDYDGLHATVTGKGEIICLNNQDVMAGFHAMHEVYTITADDPKPEPRTEMIRAWFAPRWSKHVEWKK